MIIAKLKCLGRVMEFLYDFVLSMRECLGFNSVWLNLWFFLYFAQKLFNESLGDILPSSELKGI